MKPDIVYKCTNERCSRFNEEVKITGFSLFEDNEKEWYWLTLDNKCPYCFNVGELTIKHGNRVFDNRKAFEEYLLGIIKQSRLLKRLVEANIATAKEQEEYKESHNLLSEIKCSCCGRLYADALFNK